jgi:hypothetical protein
VRRTRENTAIIKGFNDSFARYWGFVLSLITHFNKRISLRCSRASWAALPSVCVTFISRRFIEATDHRCTSNPHPRVWCPVLGGQWCTCGLSVLLSALRGALVTPIPDSQREAGAELRGTPWRTPQLWVLPSLGLSLLCTLAHRCLPAYFSSDCVFPQPLVV